MKNIIQMIYLKDIKSNHVKIIYEGKTNKKYKGLVVKFKTLYFFNNIMNL